jgi:hypothetical protein
MYRLKMLIRRRLRSWSGEREREGMKKESYRKTSEVE